MASCNRSTNVAAVSVKILLTECLRTFTVTLLAFYPQQMEHFASFLRTLTGLR